jgi:Tol biopolymer transport system component
MRPNARGTRAGLTIIRAGLAGIACAAVVGCGGGGKTAGGDRGTIHEIKPGGGVKAATPRFSPDGTRLGYTRDEGDVTAVAVMSTTGADSHTLASDGSYLTAMTWNVDGSRIIYAAADDIRGVAADGSDTSVRVVNAFAALGPDLSPDGATLAYGINGGTLHLADLTQSPQVVTDLEVTGASPRFSPDGRTLAYWQYDKLQLMDLATRSTVDVITDDENLGDGGVDWFSDGQRLVAGTGAGIEIVTLGPPVKRELISDPFAPQDVDLSPDDASVAYGGTNGQTSLFILSGF